MRNRPLRLARPAARVSVGDLVGTMRDRAASLPQAQRQVATLMLADPEAALRANVADLAWRA